MPYAYAPRLIVYLAESRPLGVAFHRITPRPDGKPGDAQHWDHEAGGWANAFDPAKHVRSMDKVIPAARPAYLCFAVPADVEADGDAIATIHVLDSKGAIAADLDMLTSADLRARAGGAIVTPG